MSEAKHTPGPWSALESAEHLDGLINANVNADGTYRGTDYNDGIRIAKSMGPDAYANARLIAAAPDMLEALTNSRSQLATLGGTAGVHMGDEDAREAGCDMIQRAVVMQIDAAIAKATGAA